MQRISLPLILGVSLVAPGLVACGDDGSGSSTGETGETGDGDGDASTSGDGDGDPTTTGDGDGDPTTTGDGDGDPTTTGDGDGDPTTTGDGDGDPTTTGDGDGDPGNCQVWEITYDLTGSEFELSDTPLGAGDQVNVVEEPYDDDENIGPGQFVIRFQDVDGAPGGTAFMHSYAMTLNFTVASPGATINTDLENDAGPTDCGITTATLDGTTAAWNPAAIVDHHSVGQLLCMGNLCGLGGLPNGMAVPIDETSDQPISDFVFNGDLSAFDMEPTEIPGNENATTTWTYVGTEVSRELVAAADCYCQ